MERYKIKIKTKNKMIPIKGKMIRSPVEFSIPDSKLTYYRTVIKNLGVTEYTIENFVKEEVKPKKVYVKNDKVKKIESNFRKGKKKSLDKYL